MSRRAFVCSQCGGASEVREERLAGLVHRIEWCSACGNGDRAIEAPEGAACRECGGPAFHVGYCFDHVPAILSP